ncbi:hypothetical protein [Halobellus rubicundus]|uniref:DUF4239 domain-containing protein n=1 Tax=Halobellus rubicundus TaxID=2996466 RepID=A0ABD5MFP4_9EURY
MVEDSSASGSEPDDTMRQRGEESRTKLWILLDANRWVVAGIAVGVFFAGVIVASVLAPAPIGDAGDPIETLFQGFVTATITGVTLVVSINSLVLSQELGTLGDQRDRMEGAMSFRRDVESELGLDVAPATPSAFLRRLVDAVETRAERLRDAATDADLDDDVAEQVRNYAEDLRRHASRVGDDLSNRQFGTFAVLSSALDFNYSWKVQEARRLRDERVGDDGATSDALDDLVSVLTLFGPAREHFKTLYFQWELVDLSRAMLYTALPALVVATSMLLFHASLDSLAGSTLGVTHFVWVVAAAAAVALVPFAALLSFVLRIGTVAKRTLSIGPFILRTTGGSQGGQSPTARDRAGADEREAE